MLVCQWSCTAVLSHLGGHTGRTAPVVKSHHTCLSCPPLQSTAPVHSWPFPSLSVGSDPMTSWSPQLHAGWFLRLPVSKRATERWHKTLDRSFQPQVSAIADKDRGWHGGGEGCAGFRRCLSRAPEPSTTRSIAFSARPRDAPRPTPFPTQRTACFSASRPAGTLQDG